MMFPFKVTVQFNWGLRPHRHNDVCFVCPCNPQCTPLNTAYALFNSLLLLLCFNNLFASAFLLFLKFLPVNYRLGLIFSPFHSMEVVGRNYCLFKYILKYWPCMAWGSSSCWLTTEETECCCSCVLLLCQRKVQREGRPNVRRPNFLFPIMVSAPSRVGTWRKNLVSVSSNSLWKGTEHRRIMSICY